MSEITRDEFSAAVATAIASVQHVYRQINRLLSELREGLAEPPDSITVAPGTFGKLGGKPSRMTLRDEYGILFGLFPHVEDDDDDDGAETARKGKKKSPPSEIRSDKPVIAVRVLVYDPKKQAASEPRIEFAALGDWRIGPDKTVANGPLNLGRTGLRRIARAIGAVGLAKDTPIGTGAVVKEKGSKVKAGKSKGDSGLSCRLLLDGVTVPLYEMDRPDAVQDLIKRIKAMWHHANQ